MATGQSPGQMISSVRNKGNTESKAMLITDLSSSYKFGSASISPPLPFSRVYASEPDNNPLAKNFEELKNGDELPKPEDGMIFCGTVGYDPQSFLLELQSIETRDPNTAQSMEQMLQEDDDLMNAFDEEEFSLDINRVFQDMQAGATLAQSDCQNAQPYLARPTANTRFDHSDHYAHDPKRFVCGQRAEIFSAYPQELSHPFDVFERPNQPLLGPGRRHNDLQGMPESPTPAPRTTRKRKSARKVDDSDEEYREDKKPRKSSTSMRRGIRSSRRLNGMRPEIEI